MGILGEEREDRVHVVHEPWHDLLRGDVEEVLDLDSGYAQPGRRDQHEPAQAMLLFDRKASGDAATQREADEVDSLAQTELIEQVHVVDDDIPDVPEAFEVA